MIGGWVSPLVKAFSRHWRTWKLVLRLALFVLLGYYLVKFILTNLTQIKGHLFQVETQFVIVSLLVLVLGTAASVLGWALLARWLGLKVPLRASVSAGLRSVIYSYIPGRVWMVGERVSLLSAYNPDWKRLGASLVIEQVANLFISIAIALALTPGLVLRGASWYYLPFFLLLLVVLVRPNVLVRLLNAVYMRVKRREPGGEKEEGLPPLAIGSDKLLAYLLVLGLHWLVLGLGTLLFLRGFDPRATAGMLLPVTGALAASFVAGSLAVFTPAGLGVREAVLSVFFSRLLEGSPGVILAALLRLASVAVAVACFAASLVLAPGGRARQRASAAQHEGVPGGQPKTHLSPPPEGEGIMPPPSGGSG